MVRHGIVGAPGIQDTFFGLGIPGLHALRQGGDHGLHLGDLLQDGLELSDVIQGLGDFLLLLGGGVGDVQVFQGLFRLGELTQVRLADIVLRQVPDVLREGGDGLHGYGEGGCILAGILDLQGVGRLPVALQGHFVGGAADVLPIPAQWGQIPAQGIVIGDGDLLGGVVSSSVGNAAECGGVLLTNQLVASYIGDVPGLVHGLDVEIPFAQA